MIEKTAQQARDEINPEFFSLLREVPNFEVNETVKWSTFLLNLSIMYNHFPFFKELIQMDPGSILKDEGSKQTMRDMLLVGEKIFGTCVLYSMKYKGNKIHGTGRTKQLINDFFISGPLVIKFFLFNTMPSDVLISDFVTSLKDFVLLEKMYPSLEFDPEYCKITNHEAFLHLFVDSSLKSMLHQVKKGTRSPYPPKEQLIKEIYGIQDDSMPGFTGDPSLIISRLVRRKINLNGIFYFGNDHLVDDLVKIFSEYYGIKIPSKRQEIDSTLKGLGTLLKLSEGKMYTEFTWKELNSALKQETDLDDKDMNAFLQRFCMERKQKFFHDDYNKFDSEAFIDDYNDFLGYACFYCLGKVRTGGFLIWRAIVKYLESFHSCEEFFTQKGILLENWCYETATSHGFQPEKVILRNPKIPTSEKYHDMKRQISAFLRQPIEMDAEFVGNSAQFDFEELDLVLAVGKYLLVFECKGTSAPMSEEPRLHAWLENFHRNIKKTIRRGNLLLYNLRNGRIDLPMFSDVAIFVPIVIQTEGIVAIHGSMTPISFKAFLKALRKAVEEDRVDDLFIIPSSE